MGGKKKYINIFGSFTEPFNCFAAIPGFYFIFYSAIETPKSFKLGIELM